MNYNYFVGIDVSKTKLDVSVIVKGSERKPFHLQIKNDETGFEHCVQVLAMEFSTLDSNWFFSYQTTEFWFRDTNLHAKSIFHNNLLTG